MISLLHALSLFLYMLTHRRLTYTETNKHLNFLTRSRAFQKLVDWAFKIVDTEKTNHIGKSDLYAGLLLVHINLAKYAGPAACFVSFSHAPRNLSLCFYSYSLLTTLYTIHRHDIIYSQPPPRTVVDKLFDAGDLDSSGGIDRQEFIQIMRVCCAQMMGRIVTYYAIVGLLVPFLATHFVDWMGFENDSYSEMASEQTIRMSFFFLLIPFLWNIIDGMVQETAEKTKRNVVVTTSTTIDDKIIKKLI
jgi:hypothetical protein